ncbi:MAG: pseudaminic acid biosynthesis-associated methylase [Methylocella sp.]
MSETEQSAFWRGQFGDDYVQRNPLDATALRNRVAMWARILAPLAGSPARSILEVGANIGINMAALAQLSGAELHAVEPNPTAREMLANSGFVDKAKVHDATGDALPFANDSIDMVFTCGVLIHAAPERLEAACREIHRVANRYIACIEYFSSAPEEKMYRGREGKLFKRDFGGYWWNLYPELTFVDGGFFWKRVTGLDDLTWWLFAKNQR